MNFPEYESSFVVSWDEFLATQSRRIWIVPKHDSSCVSVYCSRRWNICHTEHTDMDSAQDDRSCVFSSGGWIWIHCHTERNSNQACWHYPSSGCRGLGPCHTDDSVRDFPQYTSLCASWCDSRRWIPLHTEHIYVDCSRHGSSGASVYCSRR